MISIEIRNPEAGATRWAEQNCASFEESYIKRTGIEYRAFNDTKGVEYLPVPVYSIVFDFNDERDAIWFSLKWAR
jgi:hypothetical protein